MYIAKQVMEAVDQLIKVQLRAALDPAHAPKVAGEDPFIAEKSALRSALTNLIQEAQKKQETKAPVLKAPVPPAPKAPIPPATPTQGSRAPHRA